MKSHSHSLYPVAKPALLPKRITRGHTRKSTAIGLIPTYVGVILAELILHYTGSGYSVIVITLLSILLYTAYRHGTILGIVSSVLVVIYNFYAVSQTMGVGMFSVQTLNSGIVIAIVFPMLAFIIGRLKARNDALLDTAEAARMMAEESAQQLQFMAESMPQKIFTTLPNGKNVYANAQWTEYTGKSRRAMQNWSRLIHPHDIKQNTAAWNESLATGKPFQIEHRLLRKDGQYIWHLTRAKPLRDEAGNITLWIGSSTDIEDVRKARKLQADTARLLKQRTELMELNKAKDEFISLASHQLRTPATGVKQYVNMALDGYGGKVPEKIRTFLEKANTSNERQLSIINDLLKVAQIDAGKVVLRPERIDLNDMIASVIHEQRSLFDERQQTIEFTPKRTVVLTADPTKLRMVLENVIDNASKYSFAGTTISVRVSKYRGMVRVQVSDQGVGIDKSDMERIFTKFTRIDNPLSTIVGGTGLGLYWVRRVIELHGGTITVAANSPNGSTFTISLPAGLA